MWAYREEENVPLRSIQAHNLEKVLLKQSCLLFTREFPGLWSFTLSSLQKVSEDPLEEPLCHCLKALSIPRARTNGKTNQEPEPDQICSLTAGLADKASGNENARQPPPIPTLTRHEPEPLPHRPAGSDRRATPCSLENSCFQGFRPDFNQI